MRLATSVFLLLLAANPAQAISRYFCKSTDAIGVQIDGTLGKGEFETREQARYANVVIDISTGAVTLLPKGDQISLRLFQVADTQFVLQYADGAAGWPATYLWLRPLEPGHTTFVVQGPGATVVGACQPIK